MDEAFHDLRRLIREEIARMALPELGVVQELHPHAGEGDDDNYAVTLRLRDSGTVLARVPVVSARKGLAAIPDVGDLVLVQYLHGDPNAPIVTGSLYNDEDRPPLNAAGEVVLRLPSDAGEGEGVSLRVQSGDVQGATLTLGSALRLVLQDDDPVVTINVGDGAAVIEVASDGALRIVSGKSIALEGGEISLKGSTIKAEAEGEITLKGAVINLN